MKSIYQRTAATMLLIAACAVSTSAAAQSDAKRALATKLAQMQMRTDGPAMADQLTGSAVQPLLANWAQKVDESVPAAKQKDVRDKLDVELKKFAETTHKAIEAQSAKAAEAALVPLFMEKLTEDEMKTVITYLESPVSTKMQSLGQEAGNAWAKRIIDNTKGTVENAAKTFDANAGRIVNAAAPAPKK